MTGIMRELEGKKSNIFKEVGEMFYWHKNVYRCNKVGEYQTDSLEYKCQLQCAFAQRAACKWFACMANERKDKTEVYFERI